MKDIFKDLNTAQSEAVQQTEGPVMVIAGAGSGKTRVLTYRVVHLLYLGVDPFNILALTFTNKAAREMKDRIISLVGNSDAKNVWMGTFHSIFARILRREGDRLGYPSNFTIYDTDDSKSLIKSIVKELNLDIKQYSPNYILNRISHAKTSLYSAQDYNVNFETMNTDKMAGKPETGRIYSIYQKRLYKASAMDFDDLLFNTNALLRDYPDVLYSYQNKFKYILVDEYQDTNFSQYLIVKKLAANNENICVVGDDAQSIYAFRGANIQNILNFQKDYPDLKTFKLEQNYRSTQTIVKAANSIIINNKDQIFKEIWTKNESGNLIKLLKAISDNEEGSLVANSIFENKMNNQLQNDAFAILYRTNAQSRAMEEALRKLNIPYRIYGGLSFYKRKEIKDLLAYFRLAINQNDDEALNRIINFPARGIGKTTMEKIALAANNTEKSRWEIIENISRYHTGTNLGTQKKVENFATMIKSFSSQILLKNAYDMAKLIASSSGILKDLYDDKTPEGVSRFENIDELLNAIKDFSKKERSEGELEGKDENINPVRTLDEFMQDIALLTDADTDDKNETNKVSLMTIHSAKGLEFPYVYVSGLEENLFPSIQSLNSRADLEEERRLFYVAVTRSQKNLTLSYSETRFRWGELKYCEPSRFIDEIDPKYIEFPKKITRHFENESWDNNFKPNKTKQLFFSNFKNKNLKKIGGIKGGKTTDSEYFESTETLSLQVGMEVEHRKFGKGKVISIENFSSNKKATIFFKNVGQKQLLLKFAKLKILN